MPSRTDKSRVANDNVSPPEDVVEVELGSSHSKPSNPASQPSRKWCRFSKLAALSIVIVVVIGLGVSVWLFMDHTGIMEEQPDYSAAGAPLRDVTLQEVALHNTPSDCWVIYYGDVYDMSKYAKDHPGGAGIITQFAGTDGTAAYEAFHSQRLLKTVEGTKIGPLVEGNNIVAETGTGEMDIVMNAATRVVTWEELRQHNTKQDCWVAFFGDVYDMTSYASRHPGGARIITNLAGTDGTSMYKAFHSRSLLDSVQGSMVGVLGDPTNAPVNPPTDVPVQPPTKAPVNPPTAVPVNPPTKAPVNPPTTVPVNPPTKAPVDPPTAVPVQPPTKAPVDPPTAVPVQPPTKAPVDPPTAVPVQPPTKAPVDPPTAVPVQPPTKAPVNPPTVMPMNPPTKAPVNPPTDVPVNPPTKAPENPPTDAPANIFNFPMNAPVNAPTDVPITLTNTLAPVMESSESSDSEDY